MPCRAPFRFGTIISVTPSALILMGVAGSGKTTVGRMLAERLGWTFVDADDFHSAANVAKMAQGHPLTDADRAPWLQTLADYLRNAHHAGTRVVLACSALKEAYRAALRVGPEVQVVYLKVRREALMARLAQRAGHYFKWPLLESQLEALEEPLDAWTIDANGTPAETVARILAHLPTEEA